MINFDRADLSVVSRPGLLGLQGVYSLVMITGRSHYRMEVREHLWSGSLLETGAGVARRFDSNSI